jgi:thiamine kinase-like enzyme
VGGGTMANVITRVEKVTPDWLTATLKDAGVLERGRVVWVETDSAQPFGSIVSHVELAYSDEAAADAPYRLFLKLANPYLHQQWPERGKREVEFYGAIPAGDYGRLPLPRCYAAAFSVEDGFHVLLDDLAETHFSIVHPLPPSAEQCEQVVDTLARLHAYWWNKPQLGVNLGRPADQKTIFNGDEKMYPAFLEYMGDALWDERRRIFDRVLKAAPKLQERLTKGNLTLIHGDAHAWNFLYPLDPGGEAVLVDWEAWDADVGVFDLAYMITLFWFPAHRARMEKPLVQRYHKRLTEYGVTGYSWDDCWYDYRHSVIRLLFRPIDWWDSHRDEDFWPELWWPRLERVICAFEDLHCEELLA